MYGAGGSCTSSTSSDVPLSTVSSTTVTGTSDGLSSTWVTHPAKLNTSSEHDACTMRVLTRFSPLTHDAVTVTIDVPVVLGIDPVVVRTITVCDRLLAGAESWIGTQIFTRTS